MLRLRSELLISGELNNEGSISAAAQKVDPLSENIVSTDPRRLVKRAKANKKLFKSRLVTTSTCMARVHKQVKSSPQVLQ